MNFYTSNISNSIMNWKSLLYFFIFASTVLISACSSHVPPEISQDIISSPQITEVRTHTDTFISHSARWGGVIIDTENKQSSSKLTIIAFPLDSNGRPEISDQSTGRFIAVFDDFLEPQLYGSEREITVYGTILKTETRKIGEYPYEYPVIQVRQHFLWPARRKTEDYDYPPYWWYDPWYHPYYPWHSPYYPRRR